VFYDARTEGGQWACTCESCFEHRRYKLGTGLGQRYEEKASEAGGEAVWVKTAG
jgi:hypothetical protein